MDGSGYIFNFSPISSNLGRDRYRYCIWDRSISNFYIQLLFPRHVLVNEAERGKYFLKQRTACALSHRAFSANDEFAAKRG